MIKNKILTFELLNYDRLDDLFEYSSDPEFYKYLNSKQHKTKYDTKQFIDYLFERIKDGINRYWFIKLNSEDKVIGTIGLLNITSSDAELAYGMSLKYAGRGYIQNAIVLMCEYLFNDLKLDRLYGGTNINNKKVINTLLSLGFIENKLKTDDKYWYYYIPKDIYLLNNKYNQKNNIKIDDIINIIQNITQEKISCNSTMEDCLNWDSLNHITIIGELSRQYNFKFKPKDVIQSTSIQKIYKLLNNE